MKEQIVNEVYKASPAFDRLVVEHLSIRAQNAIKKLKVGSAAQLVILDADEILNVRHCGKKTTREIRSLGRAIRRGKYDVSGDDVILFDDPEWLPAGENELALNAVVKGLSSRARTTLKRLGIESVSAFMHMSLIDIPGERGTGTVTSAEIFKMKDILMDFMKNADSIPKSKRLDALCEHIFRGFVSDSEEWHLDPFTPYASLHAWVLTSARGVGKVERSVLMRFGLDGERAMTLEKAGAILRLTRERVRQLNKEFKVFAEWIVTQRRLEPIIARMARIVDSEGGRILKVELLRRLMRAEGAQEGIVNASRVIDLISDFEPWLRHGLSFDKRYVMRS